MREHIDKHPQDCLTIIRNAIGQREEGSAERTLQRLRHSVSEGKELVCWLRYVWAFCMTPRQPCSLSSTCQAQLAVLAAAHSTSVLHLMTTLVSVCPSFVPWCQHRVARTCLAGSAEDFQLCMIPAL